MIVMLVGPIDFWWNENWQTRAHVSYTIWREEVNRRLVNAGHLVYRPHEAFKGAWNERAQEVNLVAIGIADCLVNLRPANVPAYGTEAEVAFARKIGVPVYDAPPGDYSRIESLVIPLEDPYGSVHRKSYTRPEGDND